MTDGTPTGEVRPCSTGNRSNATRTRGASPKQSFGPTSGLVTALAALPPALGRRIVGLQEPASGESRFRSQQMGNLGFGPLCNVCEISQTGLRPHAVVRL